jgi:hypothetical protein
MKKILEPSNKWNKLRDIENKFQKNPEKIQKNRLHSRSTEMHRHECNITTFYLI